jgi:hypothetical protein
MWSSTLSCAGLFTPDNISLRSVAVAEPLFTLVIYFASQMLYTLMYMPGDPPEERPPDSPWDNNLWREWFPGMLSVHTACLAIGGMFYPVASAILAWMHFITLVFLCAYQFVTKTELRDTVMIVLQAMLAANNIMLIITGIAGLTTHNCT